MDLFKKWDEDDSGTVDRRELGFALRELGFDAPKHVVDALFSEMDADAGGFVDFKELHSVLRQGASVQLAKKLRPGSAGEIETESKNAIALRTAKPR